MSVTAEYSLRPDGGVRVLNRGYSTKENKWRQTEGKAYFVNRPDQENYTHALICGPDKSYLWLLARSPKINEDLKIWLIENAAALGFDTTKLISVQHDQ